MLRRALSASRPVKRSAVDSSYSLSILMASNGHTSAQMPQFMHTVMSMSKTLGLFLEMPFSSVSTSM
ncbi:MAG: hypothetical protein A2138_03915 [Deltaproteobacteria bacterium RBG_16_71_12]|nr:MAG: hypothetical protein A2138_03915 [Deltaproteobacteria bacterium RBG_16_71_12]